MPVTESSAVGAAGGRRDGAGRPPSSLKRFEFSVTIVLKGGDFPVDQVEPRLHNFLQGNSERVLLTCERGEVEKNLHLQGLIVVATTSPVAFKRQLSSAMFPEGVPSDLSISLKKLTHRGLHTVDGIVGYSLKDSNEPHFREVLCINVSDEVKDAGKLQYILHGKIGVSKNRVALNQNNIINKMMLYLKYKTANMVEFSADPFNLLLRMMNSGHYMLESKWIYCKDGLSLSRLKALWKANIFPEDLDKYDLMRIMFPRDTDLAEGSCTHLKPQRAGLFDTEADGFSRSEFSRYYDYDQKLLSPGVRRDCANVPLRIPGPASLDFKDALSSVRFDRQMQKLHQSARALREDTSFLEEDFNLVASAQTQFSARLDVLDETLGRAEALLRGEPVQTGNPFNDGDDLVPIASADE